MLDAIKSGAWKSDGSAKQSADALRVFKTHLSTLDVDALSKLADNKAYGAHARSVGFTNKGMLEWLDSLETSDENITGIDDKIKKLDKSAAGLGSTFKATAKTIAANMGVMLAISVAVTALVKIWDHLNVTLEEQQEIVDNLKTEVEDLQIAYDELASSGKLTDAEQERLNMLERQLEIKKELLALENKELAEKEILQSNQNILDGNDGMLGGAADNAIAIHRNTKALKEYRATLNEIENFDNWGAVGLAEMEKDATDALEAQRVVILEQQNAAQERYNLINNYLEAGTWDDDPAERQKWEKELERQQSVIDELQSQENEISIALGVEIDQSKAKEYIQNQVDGVDATWLQTLSDEEITYLFRLNDIGQYSPEDLKDMIEDLRNEAEDPIDVKVEISTSSYLAELEKTSDGFEKVAAVYNDVKDAGDFDFSALAKDSEFYTTFQSAGSALEDFIDIVSNSPSDINACQDAFNELVTAWFYAQDPLKNITEETKDLTIAWLKQKGVTNAAEVATSALTRAKENEWLASKNLTEASEGEIRALIAEAKSANMSTHALNKLQWALYQTSKTRFSLDGQINEFKKLYLQVMGTVSALSTYEQMKSGKTGWVSPRIQSETLKNEERLVQWKMDKDARDALATIDDYMPTGTTSSGGSSSDPWSAEIDKYEKYTRVIETLESTLSDLNRAYEHTDDIEERIALKQQEINLYAQQKQAVEDLNNARDEEIGENVDTLRNLGFNIDYDRLTDALTIHNKELINNLNLSDEQKEKYWELIEKTEELNDANKESSDQWKDLSYSILDVKKELEELHNERFDDAISDAEHLIELFSNRSDVVDEDLQLMNGIMQSLEKELQDLMKKGTEADKDRIKELQKMWMNYYDSRIERENKLLEKQKEDRDGVLSAIDNLFEERIENIDKEIEALQKTNEERRAAIELQKAQAALDKARTQKTRRVLRDGIGWVYEADEEAIKEAEETLADMEFEQTIESLEKQKEALEELKNKWAEIPDEFEKYQNKLLAEEQLGADWEKKVTEDRIDVFNDFKDEYFDIQKQIYENTKELNEHLAKEYQDMMDKFAKMIAMFNAPEVEEAIQGVGNTGTRYWYVNKNGKAPSQADVGDIVYTKGGTYRIDAKDENGKFTSTKIDNVSTQIPEGLWGTEIKKVSNTLTSMHDELKSLQKGGSVDLLNRPEVSSKIMQNAGWDTEDGSISTVNTSTYSNRDGSVAMNFTPIQVDKNGKLVRVLSEEELQRYAEAVIDGVHDDYLGLKIGNTFTGRNAITNAELDAQRIHEIHEALTTDATGANLNDSLAINALSTDGLIREAEEVNERIKDNILKSEELQNYLKNNTDITRADVDAVLDNIDYMDVLSGNTGDNTDATDDNTRELRNLIYELANIEFSALTGEDQENVYNAALDKALANFDDSLMSPEDRAYLKQIQEAWNIAMANNNQVLADELHALADSIREQYINGTLRPTVNGLDYNRVGADGYSTVFHENSRSDAYGGANVAGIIGTTTSIWGLDSTDGKQMLDAINRGTITQEEALNMVQLSGGKYNSDGSKKAVGNDGTDYSSWKSEAVGEKHETASGQGYWQTTKYTDPTTGKTVTRTDYTSYEQEKANQQWVAMQNESKKNSTAVKENSSVVTYSADITSENNDLTADNNDKLSENNDRLDANTAAQKENAAASKDLKQAYENGATQKTLTSSGGGGKGDPDGPDDPPKVTYKMDNDVNSPTFGIRVAHYEKKAKGGTNLRGNIYNVDEKGPELLIEPDEGRFVRIRQGGSVIPADVSQKLWDFGANPKSFLKNMISQNVVKINPQIVSMAAPAGFSTGNVTENHYHIQSLELHDIHDMNAFIKELPNLPNLAKQWVTSK